MIPEISEFSYGFALTNELVGWEELSVAPIFPSLIEEGRHGGGYDVNLDFPGAPLYLQFKRSECMTRRSAREHRTVQGEGGNLDIPFYRFSITERLKSAQHDMLLELDTAPNLVYYVAPRFHRIAEINSAWSATRVASRSAFVTPKQIGPLDNNPHTVAFDGTSTWVCSTPRQIQTVTSREVSEKISKTLKESDGPLRSTLPSMIRNLRDAEERGRRRIEEKTDGGVQGRSSEVERQVFSLNLKQLERPEPFPVPSRKPKPVEPNRAALREAADIAAHVFNAQLIIVQPKA